MNSIWIQASPSNHNINVANTPDAFSIFSTWMVPINDGERYRTWEL